MVRRYWIRWHLNRSTNIYFRQYWCLQNISRFIKVLTQWGRVTHICISNLAIIGSDNGLWPGLCQAIIWTNGVISIIGPLGTSFNEIWIKIHGFSFTKMSSGKWRPYCLGLNVLTKCPNYLILSLFHYFCIPVCYFSATKQLKLWLFPKHHKTFHCMEHISMLSVKTETASIASLK